MERTSELKQLAFFPEMPHSMCVIIYLDFMYLCKLTDQCGTISSLDHGKAPLSFFEVLKGIKCAANI